MAQVITEEEALTTLQAALRRWRSDTVGILAQLEARIQGALDLTEEETRRRRAHLAAIEAAASVPERRDALAAELQRASADYADMRTRASAVREAAGRLRAARRKAQPILEELVPAAISDLGGRTGSLRGYRASAVGPGVGVPATSRGNPGGAGATDDALASEGLKQVDLSQARFDDNPVVDGYHKGGTSEVDYRWALEAWHTSVQPAVLSGASRDDLARRDEESGAPPLRRQAVVYDMFMGSDRLIFDRRPDGSLDVTNGRHRVEVARSLGISHLPGVVR